jgi:uracil-DNA glycosylase family protein
MPLVLPAARLDSGSWAALRERAVGCTACPLWTRGTQTVFGEGPTPARAMLIGEQPGDIEDQTGRPFVGPAGRLLDTVLARAGIDRGHVYVTNVVKHFKWEPRGKRRIHQKPNTAEMKACRPWLDAEFALVAPMVVICLGATASQALLGSAFRVSRERGRVVPVPFAQYAMATVHPSSILRIPDAATRHAEMDRLVEDLRGVAHLVAEPRSDAA